MENMEQDMIEIDLKEYITIIWQRKLILVGLVVVALIASFLVSNRMTRIYDTSTLVLIEEEQGMDDLFGEQLGFGGRQDNVATYTELLRSRLIMESVIERLDLRNEETGELISAGSLRNKMSVSSGGDTNLLTISVEYHDPEMAQEIANTIVEVFQEENLRLNQANLQGASQFISEQLVKVQDNLTQFEDRLLDYKTEEGVVFPQEQGRAVLDRLTELEKAQARAQVEQNQAQASLEDVREKLAEQEQEVVSSKTITDNPIVSNYRQQLADLEIDLVGLEENYTVDHPQVVEVERKIKEIEARLEEAVTEVVSSRTESTNPLYRSLEGNLIDLETKIISTGVQMETLGEQIGQLEQDLEALPEQELELARLTRESKVAENLYTMLMERREEIEIQRAMQSSDMLVIDPAVVDDSPIRPRTKLNLAIAAMLALFIGLGIIFLLEFLDTTVKEEKDVERLTGLPVLGVIPDLNQVDHSSGYGRGIRDGE